MSATPIAIMSFNRPHYLRQVLQSLKSQDEYELDEQNVFFFQDGEVNEFSKKQYVSKDVVDECISLFRTIIPNGNVMRSPVNLGVALNFDRAERFLFDEVQSEIAYFLEDDLVLGKYYMHVLDRLSSLALAETRLGYFAAYGNQYAGYSEQISAAHRLLPMSHNWAFGLTRRQWIASRPLVESYLRLVQGIDYRDRNNHAIARLMHSWGFKCPGTSQDVAKSLACLASGGAKLKTYTSYGKYVGEIGLHSNAEVFDRMGFRNAVFTNENVFKVSKVSQKDIDDSRESLLKYASEDTVKIE